MNRLTCKELRRACDEVFKATTFQELTELSKQLDVEIFQKNDQAHLGAMNAMK